MTRELSNIDVCHLFRLSKFFFVEYAKRHARLNAQILYVAALKSFNSLKNYFDSNCEGCLFVNECLSECIKICRNSLKMGEDITFCCLANKAQGLNDNNNPCNIHVDYFLQPPIRKQKLDTSPLSLMYIHLQNSNEIIYKYNVSDFDFFQQTNLIGLIYGIKHIELYNSNFKRPMNSKYAYVFERENVKSLDKITELHVVSLFPEYEEPEADIKWITSNNDFVFRRICISKYHFESQASLAHEMLNALNFEIKKLKCKKLLEGLRGDSVMKRMVGLLVWDKINIERKTIESSCEEVEILLEHNVIHEYSVEYLRKIYYQTANSINKWIDYYGNMRGDTRKIVQ